MRRITPAKFWIRNTVQVQMIDCIMLFSCVNPFKGLQNGTHRTLMQFYAKSNGQATPFSAIMLEESLVSNREKYSIYYTRLGILMWL